jgi:hypothetical protein
MKNNSCNPCEGCSEIVSSDCISVQSSISCIDMSIGDNLTDVLNALGSQLCNFYNIIDGGSGLTVEEVDGTPSYTAINTLRFNQDSGFIVTQPGTNIADVRLIPTFLFPDGTYITVDMVTSGNITLSGLQNLDSQTGIVGSRVLVWKQSTKSQNGVYVQAVGAWTRATDSDTSAELNNQVVFANYAKAGTTYGGKYFNQIAISPTIGVDNIIYQVGTGNVNNKWTKGGDTVEQEESIGTIDNFDFPIKTYNIENARVFKTGQFGVGIAASPLARVHIVGQNSAVLDQPTFYAEDYAQTNSFELKRDGSIYRNGNLYAIPHDLDFNTSWGDDALGSLDSSLGQGNTAIGHLALSDAVDTWDSTATGDGAGENAQGDDCCYFGHNAGKNNDGNYCVFVGSNSDSSGSFNSGIAIGFDAEIFANSQFVLGSATAPITEMYLGEGYRSSTPGNIALRGTIGHGSNISGGNFNIYPGISTGTGITGDTIIYKAPSGSSGSSLNTASETFKIKGTNGAIYRDTYLYSTPGTNYTVTTWGANAGFTSGSNNLNNTFIGYNAGYGIPNTATEYNGNVIVGSYSLTAATTCLSVLVGDNAGARLAGNYSGQIGGGQTFIGYTAGGYCTTGLNNVVIGSFGGASLTTASYSISIGSWADTGNFSSVVGIGSSDATAANQVIWGGAVDPGTGFEYEYNDFYLGKGIVNSIATSVTINATGGSGTDDIGGDLILAGGKSTGSGTPASLLFKTSTVGSTGTTLQSLATKMTIDGVRTTFQARAELAKGTDTAAANDLTLPLDGNSFTITGNTTINAITTANWQAGSIIHLIFTGTPTVKHNTAGGAGTATMKLAAGVDFVISKNPTVLGLLYDGTNWLEISRSANAV